MTSTIKKISFTLLLCFATVISVFITTQCKDKNDTKTVVGTVNAAVNQDKQVKDIHFTFELANSNVKKGEKTELIIRFRLSKDWHFYGTDFDHNLGPVPASISFKSTNVKVVGDLKSINSLKKMDDIFGGIVAYYEHNGELRQEIEILEIDSDISGKIMGQICSDKEGKCIQVKENFTLTINKNGNSSKEKKSIVNANTDTIVKKLEKQTIINDSLIQTDTSKNTTSTTVILEKNTENRNNDLSSPKEEGSLWVFFFVAFLSGLASLITPCVYPMVPMTVTFFTKASKNRKEGIKKAAFYGFSIIFLFTITGAVLSKLFGPEIANVLSTHWIPNMLFFTIFIIFALSFLGLFELTLPNSLVNKMDAQSDRGGYYGIFFMAITIVLVSFSCTGPIAGSLLVASFNGETLRPLIGMLGYSLAFAIPFTLFAIFPSWLQSLPKSGSWLNTVKVSLGFLELALAFKFFSQADLAYHWEIMTRDVFLSIHITVAFALAMYLLGLFRLNSDGPSAPISVGRLLMGVFSLGIGIYMIPGLFGAPLKPLAGYLPPLHTQNFIINSSTSIKSTQNSLCELPLHADLLHGINGVNSYFDYQQGLDCAKKTGKKIFLDFTGHGCANCRRMEENVFSNEAIIAKLNSDYIVISLYCDDRTELPINKHYTSTYDNELKKTIGEQNADLQISKFNGIAQPYYVLLDSEGKLLKTPMGSNYDINVFLDYLSK